MRKSVGVFVIPPPSLFRSIAIQPQKKSRASFALDRSDVEIQNVWIGIQPQKKSRASFSIDRSVVEIQNICIAIEPQKKRRDFVKNLLLFLLGL
jgi:hypothetical protein